MATTDDVQEQVEHLERARAYDPRNAEVYRLGAEVGTPLAERGRALYQEGLEACAALKPSRPQGGIFGWYQPPADAQRAYAECLKEQTSTWTSAYALMARAMRANPVDAWTRRYAEEARALKLGIDPASKALQEAERAERKAEADKRRREYDRKKKEREARKTPPAENTDADARDDDEDEE